MATHFTLSLPPSKPFKRFSSFTKSPPLPFKKPLSITSLLSPTPLPAAPPLAQTFWQWLGDQGVVSPKTPAKPAVVTEGLGLVAMRDISRNEVVLEIPKKLWINPDVVAASEIGSVCGGLKPWVAVALFLTREALKEDSFWRPYLDVLPESTNSTIFCAGQKRSLLSFKEPNY